MRCRVWFLQPAFGYMQQRTTNKSERAPSGKLCPSHKSQGVHTKTLRLPSSLAAAVTLRDAVPWDSGFQVCRNADLETVLISQNSGCRHLQQKLECCLPVTTCTNGRVEADLVWHDPNCQGMREQKQCPLPLANFVTSIDTGTVSDNIWDKSG